MPQYEETKYHSYGLQLRSIREKLRLTLENIRQHIGISRSYVSEFEKGIKLPTVKYLRYLHDRHGVNLNYVFCSQGHMFRNESGASVQERDFGQYKEDVAGMIDFMEKVPHALFNMLGSFAEYKVTNKAFLKQYEEQLKEKGDAGAG